MKKLYVLLIGAAAMLPLHAQESNQTAEAPEADAFSAPESSSAGTEENYAGEPADAEAPADTEAPADAMASEPADDSSADAMQAEGEPAADSGADSMQAEGEPAAAMPEEGAAGETAQGEESAPAEAAQDESQPAEAATDYGSSYGGENASASGGYDSGADTYGSSEETAAAEEPPADPYKLYLGADYNRLNVSISSPAMAAALGGRDFDARMYSLRAGIRVLKAIGIELQGGAKGDNGVDPGKIQISNYFGIFIVPTGKVLDLFEVSTPLGFNSFQLIRGNDKERFQRPSYGLNIEFPLRNFVESLPDLRVTSGYKVYYSENSARVYGYHFGLRFDFQV